MNYPAEPGYKEDDTSKEAAESFKETAATIRGKVVSMLFRHGPQTADEVAKKLGLSVLAVRPRFSELKNGFIADTGKRRLNLSGKRAKVWKLTSDYEWHIAPYEWKEK
jgi:predicted ArsR family transcriptional regulator